MINVSTVLFPVSKTVTFIEFLFFKDSYVKCGDCVKINSYRA